MSIKTQIEDLAYKTAALEGTVKCLVDKMEKLQQNMPPAVSLKPLLRLIAICFSGIFLWLGVLTALLAK